MQSRKPGGANASLTTRSVNSATTGGWVARTEGSESSGENERFPPVIVVLPRDRSAGYDGG